jgi:hypothetical protein
MHRGVPRASAGSTVRLIPVSEVICPEAADKDVTVVTAAGEPQVRTCPLEHASQIGCAKVLNPHLNSASRKELR